jgi:hypothetical protein
MCFGDCHIFSCAATDTTAQPPIGLICNCGAVQFTSVPFLQDGLCAFCNDPWDDHDDEGCMICACDYSLAEEEMP